MDWNISISLIVTLGRQINTCDPSKPMCLTDVSGGFNEMAALISPLPLM